MNAAAYFSSRVTSSVSARSFSLGPARNPSSISRRKSTPPSSPNSPNTVVLRRTDMRCMSTQYNLKNNSKSAHEHDATSFRNTMLGLSVAAVATAGAYSVDSKTHDQASSLCSPDLPDLLPDLTLNEDTKTLVWFERKKENIKLSTEGDMMYQPAPVATLSGRAIGVFEDSVSTASKWKKEAQETVLKMKGQFPNEYDVSVRALKGDRISMEDRYCIQNDGKFAAVFDGHGGGCVSTYLSEKLLDKMNHLSKKQINSNDNNDSLASLTKNIKTAFNDIDEEILENDDYQYQGSTAVAVWVHEDVENNHRSLVSANVGDSRAILSRQKRAIDLTRDHKPNDELERKRIQSMGEDIEWDPYCSVHRVRNLSLSRAIGDRFAKPVVIGEVEIQMHPLNDCGDDDFVVLASDGLWDVMTSQVSNLESSFFYCVIECNVSIKCCLFSPILLFI
mmetsp:Transcript_21660/g.26572  ORF Transcript_21660/g.26572 Transcript_21660/m.26572 type:complete len:448 (-) Transcript_21660:694-2037(-)